MDPIAVIGTGVGGLASAIRLRAKGHPVVMFESGDQPGGRARVFEQDGFSFDAGPTVITAPYLFEELFELVGRDWRDYYQLVPVDPFYRINYHDGSVFDYVGDEERLIENIREFNPDDVDGYLKLAEHSRRIFDVGYMELVDQPFSKVWDMVKVIPDMMRLQNYRTVWGLVSKYIKDHRLRQAFTFQPLLIGGNPFNTTSIYLLIHWLERKWGVHYALGGTTSIIKAMEKLLGELGVEIRYNSPVAEIEVTDGRATAVITESGARTPVSRVVSNADPSMVYKHMIDPAHRRKHSNRRVEGVDNSMSLFVGYMGTKKVWPEQAHHTIVLGPRYKGLLDDIFNKKKLADDFSLYLHAPTRTDPSVAPDGHENMYVLSPVPNLKAGVDWDEIGEEYFDKVLEELENRMLPGLRDNIVTKKFITPDYFREELRSKDGAAFGPEPKLTQSAWFRYHNDSEDVNNLYFVGAGTHPGAGLPGVLSTAKVVERMIEDPAPSEALPIPNWEKRKTA